MATGDVSGGSAPKDDDSEGSIKASAEKVQRTESALSSVAARLSELLEDNSRIGQEISTVRATANQLRSERETATFELLDAVNGALQRDECSLKDALAKLGCRSDLESELGEQWEYATVRLAIGDKQVFVDEEGELIWGELTALHPDIYLEDWPTRTYSLGIHTELVRFADDSDGAEKKFEYIVPAQSLDNDIVDSERLMARLDGSIYFTAFEEGHALNLDMFNEFGKLLDILQWKGEDVSNLGGKIKRWSELIARQVSLRHDDKSGRWSLDNFDMPTIRMDGKSMDDLARAVEVMRTYLPEGYEKFRRNVTLVMALKTQGTSGKLAARYAVEKNWNEGDLLNFAQIDTGMTDPAQRYLAAQQLYEEGMLALAEIEEARAQQTIAPTLAI